MPPAEGLAHEETSEVLGHRAGRGRVARVTGRGFVQRRLRAIESRHLIAETTEIGVERSQPTEVGEQEIRGGCCR